MWHSTSSSSGLITINKCGQLTFCQMLCHPRAGSAHVNHVATIVSTSMSVTVCSVLHFRSHSFWITIRDIVLWEFSCAGTSEMNGNSTEDPPNRFQPMILKILQNMAPCFKPNYLKVIMCMLQCTLNYLLVIVPMILNCCSMSRQFLNHNCILSLYYVVRVLPLMTPCSFSGSKPKPLFSLFLICFSIF